MEIKVGDKILVTSKYGYKVDIVTKILKTKLKCMHREYNYKEYDIILYTDEKLREIKEKMKQEATNSKLYELRSRKLCLEEVEILIEAAKKYKKELKK